MRKTFIPVLVLAASALAGAGLAAAKAPPPDPAAAGTPMMGEQFGPGHFGARHLRHHRPGAHLEGRLAFLKTELGITSGQEGLWKDFADAARKSAKTMEAAFGALPQERPRDVNVPAMLARRDKMLNARLAAFETLKTPTEKLYDGLSDAQKKTADDLLRGRFGVL